MFRQAMTVFNPFAAGAMGNAADPASRDSEAAAPRRNERPADDDLKAMREQLVEMQKRIEALDARKTDTKKAD